MTKKKAVITGSGSFTSGYLSKKLFDHGFQVYGIDVQPSGRKQDDVYEELITCDILQREKVISEFKKIKPDYVFHLAFPVHGSKESNDLLIVGVQGTRNILDALSRNRLSGTRTLIVSSAAVYGKVDNEELPINEDQSPCPASAYGMAKLEQELAARKYFSNDGMQVIIARTFNLFGPGQSASFVVPSIIDQIAQREREDGNIVLGNIRSKRDFVDVRDAVDAYAKLILNGAPGEAYNVCSGKSFSVEEVVQLSLRMAGRTLTVKTDRARVRAVDPGESRGDPDKIRKETGWERKFTMEDTLRDMLKHKKEEGER